MMVLCQQIQVCLLFKMIILREGIFPYSSSSCMPSIASAVCMYLISQLWQGIKERDAHYGMEKAYLK